ISCTESERLQDMQVRIAGVLDLSRDDESPLLQFFKQADSEKEPLDQSTRAAEIVGCTIHVVLQEHPDWYVQKCFSRRRTAELNWDVDEERTERLSLLPDGQFTYEMRRLAWDEDVGRLAVKEDTLHGTGRWRCVLQVGMPGALPEEVLLLEGSASWLSSGDAIRGGHLQVRRATLVLVSAPFSIGVHWTQESMRNPMSASTPSFGSSAMSYPFSGALVCFDVCLMSGRAAVISCTESERLQDMQVRIAGVLDLGRDDESPLLQFFKQADSEKEPLDQSTRAAEIVGCTIHVVLQEHPDWYVQKCFSRRRTAELNWDVDEERTERLSLLPDGQFTYEIRRLAWDEDVGRLAVKEDTLHGTGRWRCVLQVSMPGALPEEVLLLEGSASWLSSGRGGSYAMSASTPPFGSSAMSCTVSGALVCFDVCLVSGRAAVISCTESERLQDMQVRIAGVLDLGRDDETPLLQFFKQADSEKEPLDQSTRAAEIVGCTIHVVLQEHPDWYVQKCFSRRRTAQLNWDVDEERTERLSLLPDGQFTYEMRRLAWDEDVGRLAVREDTLHGTGRWRCVLQVGMPGALPEEVLLLEGSASWLSSGRGGRLAPQRIRRALPKVALKEYEISLLLT
ncbi:unnamed protein product, partial [Symbiodinium sp. CCMP2592]